MSTASSEQQRGQGNEHFRLARSQPAARVPERRRHLWSALDCYKAGLAPNGSKAALCLISLDGIDIVLEAEVCSAIGNLCLSFFGAESSAEKHFKRCIELVLCHLTGDCEIGCRSEPWYATAERGLRNLQERRAKRRDEERLKELEADGTLADLKANKECGSDHFLLHIYTKYPPEDTSKVMPATDQPLKKRLTVALLHYHPDKVNREDRRRYYLCEEITKYLNVFFETTKGD